MKKVLSLFLSIVMAFGITAGFSGVNETVYGATSEGDFYITEGWGDYDGYYISGYDGEDTDLVIPSTIDGKKIVGIYRGAFQNDENITSVVIPDGVKDIRDYAFNSATNLTSITLPDSVESIAPDAFTGSGYYYDENNWKDGVLYIDNALIYAKASVSGSYKVKEGTTVIADYGFDACENLTEVVLPSSLKSIGEEVITNKALTSITVDGANPYYSSKDGVLFNKEMTRLIQYPRGNQQESYTVPSSVTTLGDNAFTLATGLKSVKVPDSVTHIGTYTFYFCTNLSEIDLPNSLEFVGYLAFDGTAYYMNDDNWYNGGMYIDNVLYRVNSGFDGDFVVKDGTTIIAETASPNRTGMTSLTIPGSVKYINEYAFNRCNSLEELTFTSEGLVNIGNGAFYNCYHLTSVELPEGVEYIANDAFCKCWYLDDIKLPSTLTFVGNRAFLGTRYYENNDNWTDDALYIGSVLIDTKETLGTSYDVAEGTRVIAQGAFDDAEDLTSVTLPESLVAIPLVTFDGYKLETIKIKAKNCTIADAARTINSKAIIYGVAGSTAYDYAKKYNRTFKCLTHTYKDKVTKATTSKAGEIKQVCSVCGETGKVTAISSPKEVILSAKNYTYNGKVKKPTVTVKDSTGKTISKSNYTVKYSSGLKKVGTYKVTVTFKGNYSGTLTATYKINPKGTSLTKMYKRSKGFTAMWKKQGTQTTGYQVQYSTSSNFTDAKTVGVSKTSQISKRVTGLKGKTKYYVRVRTYKTVNGVKYYSGWSKAKSVTTYK